VELRRTEFLQHSVRDIRRTALCIERNGTTSRECTHNYDFLLLLRWFYQVVVARIINFFC